MSLAAIWRQFTLMFLFMAAAAFVLFRLLGMVFPDFTMNSVNSVGFIIPVLAAMQVGQRHYSKTGTRLAGASAWKAALLASVTVALFGVGVLMVMGKLLDAPLYHEIMRDPGYLPILAVVVAGMAGLQLPGIRAALWFGGRSAEKSAERLATKGK
ncbi:MAG: ABZJ_00895 family protein [Paracoccus sp. (in: a-proteobacteria)]|nr:ABZJ_00895 family protein [Paracoccus sp. (in: a-proteobacteria)]